MEVEIALCHDLIEDTTANYSDLKYELNDRGYNQAEIENIMTGVKDLTDVYVHEDYPSLNRQKRKALEATRLIETSAHSQTVKYADVIDNTTSIVEHDEGFARIYLREVTNYLYKLDRGNKQLYSRCVACVENALRDIR